MYFYIPEDIDINFLRIDKAAQVMFEACMPTNPLTKKTYINLWKHFSEWAQINGFFDFADITTQVVEKYGKYLVLCVSSKELNSHAAQNRLTAVNSIIYTLLANQSNGSWVSVSGEALGLPPRSTRREFEPDTLNRNVYEYRIALLSKISGSQEVAILQICREFGFTYAESARYDALTDWKAHKRSFKFGRNGYVRAWDGRKGSQRREVPITTKSQIEALHYAALAQGKRRQLIDDNKTVNQWREVEMRKASKIFGGFLDLRAAYACERFQALTGYPAPCAGGKPKNKIDDTNARMVLCYELGLKQKKSLNAQIG